MKSKEKQQGTFIVEFALLAGVFSLLILFTADVVHKQNVIGQLDRLSYSAVDLLKERNQFYNGEEKVVASEVAAIEKVLTNSLNRSLGDFKTANFALSVEQQLFDINNIAVATPPINRGAISCQAKVPLATLVSNIPAIAPITNTGHRARVYQVTLCYQVSDFFGTGDSKLSSFSFSLGR